jgi:aryl-alcohol dehydrogenase-like predicted oxidoreductase
MVIRRPAMLPRNVLGRTGIEVALLGFGAEAIGRTGRSFEDAQRTLNSVLELGISLIDTASAYGNSEEFLGRALGKRHRPAGDFTIVTKCGFTGDWQPAWKPAEIAATVDDSLKKLQIEALDVLLLHSCELEMLQRGEVIEALKQARDAGKAKFIGYSGDNEALRYAIDAGFCDVIECSFNMLDQANGPMIEAAAKNNIGVLIKRTIANSVPGAKEKPKSDYAAQYWPRWEAIGLKPADVDEIPWLEAAMRFSGYWPGVTCALIGSSNADHMRLNAQWLENGPLPASVVKRVREAFAKVGKEWPGLG